MMRLPDLVGAPRLRAVKKEQKLVTSSFAIYAREVDFIVTERSKPVLIVECKFDDADVDGGIRYLRAKYPTVDAWQISASGRKGFVTPDGIRAAPALSLLRTLV